MSAWALALYVEVLLRSRPEPQCPNKGALRNFISTGLGNPSQAALHAASAQAPRAGGGALQTTPALDKPVMRPASADRYMHEESRLLIAPR